MRKVYNLKLDIDSPIYQLTDEEFCEGLKEVIADEMGDEIKYVKLTAECVDKDQQIAELQQRVEMLRNGILDDESLKTLVEESHMYKELKAENERLIRKLNDDVRYWRTLAEQRFKQLKDNTKQVRKEVCDDFKRRFLATCQIEKGCDTASFSLEVLNRILDQLEEYKEK